MYSTFLNCLHIPTLFITLPQLNYSRQCCNLASLIVDIAVILQASVVKMLATSRQDERTSLLEYSNTLETLVPHLTKQFSPTSKLWKCIMVVTMYHVAHCLLTMATRLPLVVLQYEYSAYSVHR